MKIFRLTPDYIFPNFDCGDKDLNEYLLEDSKPALASLLAVTYLIEDDDKNLIGYFCVSNDKISIQDAESNRKFKKVFQSILSGRKAYKSYPSVKIGRLAINSTQQNKGFGQSILDYIKNFFITNNKTGCMYITVDAYSKSLNFYTKNRFQFLRSNDPKTDPTRLMYYDLTNLTA